MSAASELLTEREPPLGRIECDHAVGETYSRLETTAVFRHQSLSRAEISSRSGKITERERGVRECNVGVGVLRVAPQHIAEDRYGTGGRSCSHEKAGNTLALCRIVR